MPNDSTPFERPSKPRKIELHSRTEIPEQAKSITDVARAINRTAPRSLDLDIFKLSPIDLQHIGKSYGKIYEHNRGTAKRLFTLDEALIIADIAIQRLLLKNKMLHEAGYNSVMIARRVPEAENRIVYVLEDLRKKGNEMLANRINDTYQLWLSSVEEILTQA